MSLFRYSLAFIALICVTFIATAASAQEPDEDTASLDAAYAAIMASMPREGDLIKLPYVSALSTFGDVESETIDDPDVPGHKALRVTASRGRNDWDASVVSPIGPAVSEGDLLVMVYYLRVEEGSPEMPYNAINLASPPFNAVIQSADTIKSEWDVYIAQGKADKDYKENSLGMSMHVANADHTIDVGPVFVLNLGQEE